MIECIIYLNNICIFGEQLKQIGIMRTLQLQWEAKQEEIFMLQDCDQDNSELISVLELEIHELMRQDWNEKN